MLCIPFREVISLRKKIILFVCLFFLLFAIFFVACRGQRPADETILELRERFLGTEQSFTAELIADYGTYIHQFTLSFCSAGRRLSVLQPEILAGIDISISESGTMIHFDGTQVDTGPITQDGLTPLAALPIIHHQWQEGHITAAFYETFSGLETLVMQTAVTDTVAHITWFDAETFIPIKSTLLEGGTSVITVFFEGSPLFGQNA